jgi:hypothetical protein
MKRAWGTPKKRNEKKFNGANFALRVPRVGIGMFEEIVLDPNDLLYVVVPFQHFRYLFYLHRVVCVKSVIVDI